MNKENTEILFNKYPKLFKRENLPYKFECGDGWFNIIDNLSEAIQSYLDNNEHICKQITVVQIKEKFGGLRYYCKGANDIIRGMIWFAENLSVKICELCGDLATIDFNDNNIWLQTRCKKHKNVRRIQYENSVKR